ncbi:MAG: nucleotidyltransferase domain-containing protein [Balneolaceae bacterium]|nr:nucleotidyltransferase domain-containing protein [Balneolaceae bacterium]
MDLAELKNEQLKKACEDYGVKELYVFGSFLSDTFADKSDLDFLVEFDRSGYQGAFNQYMGFKQELEEIYQRPVDLVKLQEFRNPVFQEEVERSKQLVYAA